MRLAVLLVAACLLQLGHCRPDAEARAEARDPFFTRVRDGTTWFYSVDLTVDSATNCSVFRASDISMVVFRTSLKATLEELAGESFIGEGRVRCRNSLGGGTIRLLQVIVETLPGTSESVATGASEAFATAEGEDLFFTKLSNRMTNIPGFLEDFKSAYLATYTGGRSALGFSTALPERPQFNHRTDLEKLLCSATNPASCPSLCTCLGECLNGFCLVTGECAVDSDCKDENPCGKTRCDTATAKCVFASNTTECINPFLYGRNPSVCNGNGVCRICRNGADCAGSDVNGICYDCDLTLNQCSPKKDGTTCAINGKSGFCYSGTCQGCRTDKDCASCETCELGTCVKAKDGTTCYYNYLTKPTGYCESGVCEECVSLTPTTSTCPTGATCSSSNKCTCTTTGKKYCLKADGTVDCSADYVQLCADAQCKTTRNFCKGDFTDLTNFLWLVKTVNLGVYTAGSFTLVLYGATGYTTQLKSITATGNYDYYAKNGGKLLDADVLSMKFS